MVKVDVVNKSKHDLPKYMTQDAAGMDIKANIDKPITIKPLERVVIPTGIFIALPKGYELQIRPRSGLALKNGITLVNSPGTIDADYRGEIGIILINLSNEDFIVNDGNRIAQILVKEYEIVEWQERETLDKTDRGDIAFGNTGI